MPDYRVLLMLPKTASPEETAEWKAAVKVKLETAAPHIQVTCTSAVDDREESKAAVPSWSDWGKRVATGVDFMDRTPLYNCIGVFQQQLGRASGEVCHMALESRRMVLFLDTLESWKQVTTVVCRDKDDWISGWYAETS
jgi:hypothetical protein